MSAHDNLNEVQFPGSLRKHMQELHSPERRPLARANEDLVRQHAREHWRMHGNHIHAPDNAGELAGPNTDQRRPSGWYTGEHAIMRPAK